MGNDFARLTIASPHEFSHSPATIFVVVQPNAVTLPGFESNLTCVGGRSLVDKTIDKQFIVYPEPDTIIGGGAKGIGFRVAGFDLPRPSHGEGIAADGGVRLAGTPIKVDGGVDAGEGEIGKVNVVVVLSLEPIAQPDPIIVGNGDGGRGLVTEFGIEGIFQSNGKGLGSFDSGVIGDRNHNGLCGFPCCEVNRPGCLAIVFPSGSGPIRRGVADSNGRIGIAPTFNGNRCGCISFGDGDGGLTQRESWQRIIIDDGDHSRVCNSENTHTGIEEFDDKGFIALIERIIEDRNGDGSLGCSGCKGNLSNGDGSGKVGIGGCWVVPYPPEGIVNGSSVLGIPTADDGDGGIVPRLIDG